MTAISCNFHIDESVGFFIHSNDDDVHVVTIAETRASYPDVNIFCHLADLRRFRDALDSYLSTLPAEGVVDSERKEDMLVT